ncbi:MAG: glycosyltransferase family 2 protein [Bacteroidales bacterium]|nr:glycosyltransferase family 2 protein [Bacteroidales bacterium]
MEEKKDCTTQPLVSVIVTVYNMENYVGECIESILATEYENFEVIIVDDGSTDGSLDIVKQYAQKYKRIEYITQPNAGVCIARNNGILRSHGEYILPIDADDKITPTFIGDAVEKITSDPNIKVVCPKSEYFGTRSGEWRLPPFSLGMLAYKNMIPCSSLFRKEEWERVGGFDSEIPAREDWMFWIAVLKDGGEVVTLDRLSFFYRIKPNTKRVNDRKKLKLVIDRLNSQYPDFFKRELGGPLRYHRKLSKLINRFIS